MMGRLEKRDPRSPPSNLDYTPTTPNDVTRKITYREAAREISGDLATQAYNAGVGGKLPDDLADVIEVAVDRMVYNAQVLIGENGRGNVVEGAWDPERDPRIGKAADEMAAKVA